VATANQGSAVSIGAVRRILLCWLRALTRIIGQTVVVLAAKEHAQGTLMQPPEVVQAHEVTLTASCQRRTHCQVLAVLRGITDRLAPGQAAHGLIPFLLKAPRQGQT